ncbi:MAG: spermidine/putrescine ABC transporter substrate-binding protein [Planctomycetes bacterium]|nr:spermidine/putrescine ABC transporter substrate-binding protein [Planctomycetota bacterium]
MAGIRWILLAATVLAAALTARAGEGDKVLYIYTWAEYFDPEVVRDFERAKGCRVEFDYFDSYDTMYERIRHGGSGYDLITPAADLAEQLDKQNLLLPLTRRLIPNLRHLDTTRLVPFPDLEMRYHAPYTWSITVIGYNRKKVGPNQTGSWDLYARPGFEGRGSMMNDPRHVLGAALKFLGYSLNSTDPREIREAGEILRSWKKTIAVFDVIHSRHELEAGRLDFIQAFSGDLALTVAEHPDVDFFVPVEGSILNSD